MGTGKNKVDKYDSAYVISVVDCSTGVCLFLYLGAAVYPRVSNIVGMSSIFNSHQTQSFREQDTHCVQESFTRSTRCYGTNIYTCVLCVCVETHSNLIVIFIFHYFCCCLPFDFLVQSNYSKFPISRKRKSRIAFVDLLRGPQLLGIAVHKAAQCIELQTNSRSDDWVVCSNPG